MATHVRAHIAYLLDTETTSELAFDQALLQNKEIYHERNRSILQTIIHGTLEQWKDAEQREQSAAFNRMAVKVNDDTTSDDESSSDEAKNEPVSDSDEHAPVPAKHHQAKKVSTANIYAFV